MISVGIRLAVAKAAVRTLMATGVYYSYFGVWRGALFDYAQKLGLHILPVHYYSPIPTAKAAADKPGNFILDEALNVLKVRALLNKYDHELSKIFSKLSKGPHDYDPLNSQFSPIDSGVLYGMVRERRPERIIEIGSGMSTLIAATAIQAVQSEDPSYRPKFTCIEPYMPNFLDPPPDSVTEVIERKLQDVPRKRFDELKPGDFLFIDSTHVVKYGSDVVYEFLDILPNLQRGVHIHVHDIFIPYDYPAAWIEQSRHFWNEQYLLQAVLSFDSGFEIDAAVHAAYRSTDEALSQAGSLYTSGVIPASFWLTRRV